MSHAERIVPAEPTPSEEPTDEGKAPGKWNRLAVRAAKVAGGLTLAAGVLIGLEPSTHTLEHVGFTLSPSVSSAGTETLIDANNALRDYGPDALVIGATAGVGYAIARRRRGSKLSAMHDITHQTSRWPRVTFTAVVMGIAASASGLGDASSHGANEPVRAMADMLGADPVETPIVTGYANTPYNPSVIDFDKVRKDIEEAGGTAIPFSQNLGEIKTLTTKGTPPGAPILAVPNAILEKSLHVSLPEITDCSGMEVIVGKQLHASEGDVVTINDRPAHVAGTVDMKPGLNRVAVIGSLEQIDKCLYPNQPVTGAVALGLNGKQAELQQKLHDTIGLAYTARSFDEFQQKYQEFWDSSVKPPEMNLILDALLLGGIAIGYMQKTEISLRRKNIAMLLSQGVEKKAISRAHLIATQKDTLLAAPASIGTATIFTAITNSSQFGLAEAVNLSSVGAGYTAAAGVTALSSIIGSRLIRKTNVAQELRSSV